MPTAESSARSTKRRKKDGTLTSSRARRGSKVSTATRLSVVQSALARLGESGVEVYVREENGNLIVTIVKAGMNNKNFVLQ